MSWARAMIGDGQTRDAGMMHSSNLLGTVGFWIEAFGVVCILIGFAISTVWVLIRLTRIGSLQAFGQFRQDLARSILLGLEFLWPATSSARSPSTRP